MKFDITIVGSPDDGFTSAEVLRETGDVAARVFELHSGWYVESGELELLRDPVFIDAILEARARLLHFVNRRGGSAPEGLTRAGMSLWLMQRDDGKGFSAP